jgi:hypothetical protein
LFVLNLSAPLQTALIDCEIVCKLMAFDEWMCIPALARRLHRLAMRLTGACVSCC